MGKKCRKSVNNVISAKGQFSRYYFFSKCLFVMLSVIFRTVWYSTDWSRSATVWRPGSGRSLPRWKTCTSWASTLAATHPRGLVPPIQAAPGPVLRPRQNTTRTVRTETRPRKRRKISRYKRQRCAKHWLVVWFKVKFSCDDSQAEASCFQWKYL